MAALLAAAPTSLWMVAMMSAPEEALAMMVAPRVSEVLPLFLKTSVSIVLTPTSLDQGFKTLLV